MNKPAPYRKRPPKEPDLRVQAHEQIMDLLKLADSSKNPEIAKAAVRLANERQKQQQKADAKISPYVATLLATVVAVATIGACWYALVYHPGSLGVELAIVISAIAILVICMYALFSGHLSQSNFMVIFHWVGKQLEHLGGPKENSGTNLENVSANDDETLPPA